MSYLKVTDEKRAKLNEARLKLMSPGVRPNIAAIIAEMENRGWKPIIDAAVYRTPSEQAALKAKGYSKVSYSFHTCTDPGGVPASLAADIVDARYGWEAPRAYAMELAFVAEMMGMETGIRWGLSSAQRGAITNALKKQDFQAKLSIGWDELHTQPRNFSLGQAKSGERPKLPTPLKPVPPVVLLLNDSPLDVANWKAPGYWEVSYAEVANVLKRNVGQGDVLMSIRDALDRLDMTITKIGDHRKDKARFYIYAAAKSK